MHEFGVDEAGKGPVLGSMFAAAVAVDPADLPDDVGDSKGIAPERRRELDAAIREVGAVGVAEVTVERIDDEETDMNSLTVAAHAEAVDALADAAGATPTDEDPLDGYVDAGDTNAVRFERRVEDAAEAAIDARAEHGADETYAVVGAASIVAKVARDAHVEALAEEYGDVGSGYPGDETTREFLEAYVADHEELPGCARASWQTSKDALAAVSQSSLGEFEPDGGRAVAEPAEETTVRSDGSGLRRTTLDDF
ncbi:ribonuclease HII [Halosimplex rubrum]|uniref:Ribonuclease HII n=1 Tax=Halosimplex rubrum TaxID=869889 RepID=A0A7D5P2Z1_9EURY|nr:ribonuclease HII [Halosimplex rubrum]QLH76804.1 ribonuclease HII [Halosimplex rubrum]